MIILNKKLELERYEMAFFAYVSSENFPWFYKTNGNYEHDLMETSNLVDKEGVVKSNFFQPCKYILSKLCKKNNISIKHFYGGSFITLPPGVEHEPIRMDHVFDHHVFIMNISEFTGNTYLFDDNNKPTQEIDSELFRAVIFKKTPYAFGYSTPGERRIQLKMTFQAQNV